LKWRQEDSQRTLSGSAFRLDERPRDQESFA
jgi:hypothetical protein